MSIKRGEIYYADLSPVVGSEQGGIRPVLIVQNDVGNKFSPTVIAAAITSQKDKTKLPTHISVSSQNCGLAKDSIVLRVIGNSTKMDDFISLMRDHTILEICRTGTASIEKGASTLRQNLNL